jgi:polar amino acid transport system substrate-binding protein
MSAPPPQISARTRSAAAGFDPGRRDTLLSFATLLLSGCSMTTTFSPAARAELAPGGTLRAGLNMSNFLLTNKDPATGQIGGVAADLAHELGRRLGVPVQLVPYESPGKVAEAAGTGQWDIAFLGAEPQRANVINFTAAYVEIEATYLIAPGGAIDSIEAVDRPGVRISVSNKSAYELYLTRTIKHAELHRIDGVEASYQQFVREKHEVLAGLRPRLVSDVERLPGARLLPGRFTAIQQAMGTPKARTASAAVLEAFVAEMKASGFVAAAIERNKARGLTVAA